MDNSILINDFDEFDACNAQLWERRFPSLPPEAKAILRQANKMLTQIESDLYSLPSLLSLIETKFPEFALQAVITDEDKKQLALGLLKLSQNNDGTLGVVLREKNGQIFKHLKLKEVNLSPELNQALANYAMQMQMADIAEKINILTEELESIREGLENDRLATAYSCQQKYFQALSITNPQLRTSALLSLAHSAEDSRNQLMLSQLSNLHFIVEQPESIFQKVIKSRSPKDIGARIKDIRQELACINMVSLIEISAYQELGEIEASKHCLIYYAEYLKRAFLESPDILRRLDLLDSCTNLYWTKELPSLCGSIAALPYTEQNNYLIGE